MNCIKCGAPVPDGGTFCTKCGARADGKKTCISCGNLIEDSAIYCTYCGARVDGKKTCKNCGEVVDGNFCTKCGYGVKEKTSAVTAKPNQQKKQKEKGKAFGIYVKIQKILSPSLYLAAMLVLFVCSFFIGIEVTTTTGAEETFGPFYFFSDAFIEVEKTLANYKNDLNYDLVMSFENLTTIICLVVICLNFIAQTVLAIVGGIKGGRGIYRKKQTGVKKYAVGMFISYLITVLVLLGVNYAKVCVYTSRQDMDGATELTDGGLVGLILPISLIVLAFILKKVADGKSVLSASNLKKTITSVIVVLLAVTVAVLAGRVGLSETYEESYMDVTISGNATQFLLLMAQSILGIKGASVYNDAIVKTQISSFAQICSVFVAVIIVGLAIYALFSKKDFKGTLIILSSIMLALAILDIIIMSVAANGWISVYDLLIKESAVEESIITTGNTKSIGSIALLILSAVLFASVIVYSALNKKNQTKKEDSEAELE
ncbi:MAG: zinc ribbon domain-containing protein [Clostridia bacterium]|nr:zinc ribbon domain-containing protein [Clostridia bacterium]